jgi:hypothetical protein
MGASRKAPWRRKRKGEECISDGGGIILLELRSRSLNVNCMSQEHGLPTVKCSMSGGYRLWVTQYCGRTCSRCISRLNMFSALYRSTYR